MIRATLAVTLFAALCLAAPAGAQVPAAPPLDDARWASWIGCWRAVDDPAGTGARVCVAPAAGGVTVTTIVAGQRVSDIARIADGTARAVDADGCRGTESSRWSEAGLRLYRAATVACDGGEPRKLATASFFVAGPVWVDVETVEHAGTTSVRVSRLVRAATQALPDGTAIPRLGATRGPSPEALAHFTVDDVIDLSTALPPDGVQAALAEAPTTYRLNARALVAMAEAGVGDRVIDLMVGLTYPSKFVVERAVSGGAGIGGLGLMTADPFFAPLFGPAALFNCYGSYGWAMSSYWGNCAGFDPLLYSRYPGYYNGYWGPYGADWVVTQPGTGNGGTPGPAPAEGRVVNGRGYTQVRPIETTFTAGGGGFNGTNGVGSDGSSSGSSGSSGVSGSGYSGGGGGGDRTAVPRGPGGLD